MGRPKGTGQYPEDDEIGAEILAALKANAYRSKTAAIRANLRRLQGPNEEAKIRRMLRWLKRADEEQNQDWREFAKLLTGLSPDERVAAIERAERSSREAVAEFEREVAQLSARGVRPSPDLIKALLIAVMSDRDKNRQ